MLKLEDEIKVYLYTEPCDMRRGFDVLAQMAEAHESRRVRSGGLYVFFSRNRDRVKILSWDKDGFALWYKRLETGTFRVSSESATEEITGVDLSLLLAGMDLKRIIFRKKSIEGIAQNSVI